MNWAAVKLLITDFDGCWTDDAVYVDQNGIESVRCLRADGFGITRLQAAGVPVIVLSAEVNPVVAARCKKLGVRCYQGLGTHKVPETKLQVLMALSSGHLPGCANTPLSEVAYMGNDVNDIECLKAVGFPIVVPNAEKAVFDALGVQEPNPGSSTVVRGRLRRVNYLDHYTHPSGYPPGSRPRGSSTVRDDDRTYYVTSRAGGYGAVREVCDLILEARNAHA